MSTTNTGSTSTPAASEADPRQSLLLLLPSLAIVAAFAVTVVFLFTYDPGGGKGKSGATTKSAANHIFGGQEIGTRQEVRAALQDAYDRHAAAVMLVRLKGLPDQNNLSEKEHYANLWGLYADDVKAFAMYQKKAEERGPHDFPWLQDQYNFGEDEAKKGDKYVQNWRPRLDRISEIIEDFTLTANVATVRRLERGVNVLQDTTEQKVYEREIFDTWEFRDGEWKIVYTERGEVTDRDETKGTGAINTPDPGEGS